jgi:hypothetical protein
MTNKLKSDEASLKYKASLLKKKLESLANNAKLDAERKAKQAAESKARSLAAALKQAKEEEKKAQVLLKSASKAILYSNVFEFIYPDLFILSFFLFFLFQNVVDAKTKISVEKSKLATLNQNEKQVFRFI